MSSRPTLNELQDHGEFARRHIGPDPGELAVMLATIGVASLDELMDRAVPERHPPAPAARPAGRPQRAGGADRSPGAGPAQRGAHVPDRHGVLRHGHPARHPAQPPREPGLVHGLHAVPAGDQPGPAGGAPQLPDHGGRPHRARPGQRLHARRGHRRGRGHDDGPPPVEELQRHLRRRPRHPSPDDRRAPDPGRAGRHRAARRPGRGGRGLLRRPPLLPRLVRRRPRPGAGSSTRSTTGAGSRSSPATSSPWCC